MHRSPSPSPGHGRWWLLPILAILAVLGSCDVDLLEDASFDLWCGDSLCHWLVEVGEVARAPTWHQGDAGADLIGAEVALSQHSDASHIDARCIRLDLLADVAEGVSLSLELDFLDDGVLEHSAPLSSDGFRPSSYTITPPVWFDGFRIRIRKLGEGRAVIAQIRALATAEEDCPAEPLGLLRPLGAPCDGDGDCQSGTCAAVDMLFDGEAFSEAVCSACDERAPCGEGGEVCGTAYPDPTEAVTGFAYRACEPPGQGVLGDHCQLDEECGGMLLCVEGQCAECDPLLDTSGTGDCARGAGPLAPHQHHPGAGQRLTGEGCLGDGDCLSGTCQGAPLRLCSPDGRRCQQEDDCPVLYLHPTCEDVGVLDGTCL